MPTWITRFLIITGATLVKNIVSLSLLLNVSKMKRNILKSFKFANLEIELAKAGQKKPKPDPAQLKFGHTFSDHMLEVKWTISEGWNRPRICPVHDICLHPGSKIFHYAQSTFEGMKAYRSPNNRVAMFRPQLNIQRLLRSSERASLPEFDPDELLNCMKKLVNIDQDWIPRKDLCSLYIRPTFIGVQNSLGVHSSNSALLYVITCPVGPYFGATISPVSLLANPKYVRAWPGGVGDKKMSSNYAPTLYVQNEAEKQGFNQVLWLSGKDHLISEVGAMNVFFLMNKSDGKVELVTPTLDGTILPGIVRQSIIELATEWNEFSVSERPISMDEIIKLNNENRLLEMFVSGTAVSVCPVNLVHFMGKDINIPTTESKYQLYKRFLDTLTDIQYGKCDKHSDWRVPVD